MILQEWHTNISAYVRGIVNNDDTALVYVINKDSEETLKQVMPYLEEYRTNPVYREFASGMIEYVLKHFRIEMGRRFLV